MQQFTVLFWSVCGLFVLKTITLSPALATENVAQNVDEVLQKNKFSVGV